QPYVHRIRERLLRFPEARVVVSQHGAPDDGTDPNSPDNVEFYIGLKPREQWRFKDKDKLIDAMAQALADIPGVTTNFSQPSMRTDFLSRHICSSPLRLLTERPAPFHRHCLRWLPAWRAPLEGAVARFHYPSIRACRRMMSSAVVDACCVEGGASPSRSGPAEHGKGRAPHPL